MSFLYNVKYIYHLENEKKARGSNKKAEFLLKKAAEKKRQVHFLPVHFPMHEADLHEEVTCMDRFVISHIIIGTEPDADCKMHTDYKLPRQRQTRRKITMLT